MRGGRRHTGRGGVVCYLDVPAQRTKLLPLLNDGMEEAQSKYKFAPHHSKDCSMKGEAVGEYCVCVCVCVCIHVLVRVHVCAHVYTNFHVQILCMWTSSVSSTQVHTMFFKEGLLELGQCTFHIGSQA